MGIPGRRLISCVAAVLGITLLSGCGSSGTDKFEFAGQLSLSGRPFLVGSSNVN